MVNPKNTSTSTSTTSSSSSKRNLLPDVYKQCKYVVIKENNLNYMPRISLPKKKTLPHNICLKKKNQINNQ